MKQRAQKLPAETFSHAATVFDILITAAQHTPRSMHTVQHIVRVMFWTAQQVSSQIVRLCMTPECAFVVKHLPGIVAAAGAASEGVCCTIKEGLERRSTSAE